MNSAAGIVLLVAIAGCGTRTVVVERSRAAALPTHGSIEVVRDDGEVREARLLKMRPITTAETRPFRFAPIRWLADHDSVWQAIDEWDRVDAWRRAELDVVVNEPGKVAIVGTAALVLGLATGVLGGYLADCRPDCAEDTEGLSVMVGAGLGVLLGVSSGALAGAAIYEAASDWRYSVSSPPGR